MRRQAKDESVNLKFKTEGGRSLSEAKAIRIWSRLRSREVVELERHDEALGVIYTDRNAFRERCPHPAKYESTERTPAHVRVTCCLCGRVMYSSPSLSIW